MKRRRSTLFPSERSVHDPELASANADIYNIFPEIEDPVGRAWYLPLIDFVALPVGTYLELNEERIAALSASIAHEQLHSLLSQAFAACELRFRGAIFLADLLQFLTRPPGIARLQVPSFVEIPLSPLVTPFDFASMANDYDSLIDAIDVIQEITATVKTAKDLGWVKQRLTNLLSQSYDIDEPELISLLFDAYDIIGEVGLRDFGKYALQKRMLTRAEALDRFRLVLAAANGFQEKRPNEKIAPEGSFLEWYRRLNSYLDSRIPDYSSDRTYCPMNSCLSERLDELADRAINRQRLLTFGKPQRVAPGPARIMRSEADLMRNMWCEQEVNFARLTERESDPAEVVKQHAERYQWAPLAYMALARRPEGFYTFEVAHHRVSPYIHESVATMRGFESIRQQLWTGIGPLCICHPEKRGSSCGARDVLHSLWLNTEGDPDSEWKRGAPPPCIREWL